MTQASGLAQPAGTRSPYETRGLKPASAPLSPALASRVQRVDRIAHAPILIYLAVALSAIDTEA